MPRKSRPRPYLMWVRWLEEANDRKLEKTADTILNRPKEARDKAIKNLSRLSRLLHRR